MAQAYPSGIDTFTKAKTYEYSLNNSISYTSGTTNWQHFLWNVKTEIAALTGTTVWKSSNGSAVSTGSDNLGGSATGTTNATADGSAHSWIVYNLPSGCQLLISWVASDYATNATAVYFRYSVGALFTGGTASADPIATDGQNVYSTWTGFGANGYKWSRMRSTDGLSFAFVVHGTNSVSKLGTFAFFDTTNNDERSPVNGTVFFTTPVDSLSHTTPVLTRSVRSGGTNSAPTIDAANGATTGASASLAQYNNKVPVYKFGLIASSIQIASDVIDCFCAVGTLAVLEAGDYCSSTSDETYLCVSPLGAASSPGLIIPWNGTAITY